MRRLREAGQPGAWSEDDAGAETAVSRILVVLPKAHPLAARIPHRS